MRADSLDDMGSRYVRARDTLWRQLPGVTLVRTLGHAEVLELWDTGALLWAALVEPASVDELASDIAAVVNAPLDVVGRDVQAAVTELLRRGLVTALETT